MFLTTIFLNWTKAILRHKISKHLGLKKTLWIITTKVTPVPSRTRNVKKKLSFRVDFSDIPEENSKFKLGIFRTSE
jgi:hypothetical protein